MATDPHSQRRLAERSCADTTRYGEYSTHDFYGHHAAAISLAIVTGARRRRS